MVRAALVQRIPSRPAVSQGGTTERWITSNRRRFPLPVGRVTCTGNNGGSAIPSTVAADQWLGSEG